MIGYVTLGTNDLPRAAKFYDAIAKHFGVGRMMEFDTFIAWGEMGGAPGVAITQPFDGNAATVGNGEKPLIYWKWYVFIMVILGPFPPPQC